MTPLLLRRLRHMSREEVSWRARTAARTATTRVAARIRRPAWRRADIREALAPGAVDAQFEAAIDTGRWDTAQALLARRILARGPRFALDPTGAARLAADIAGAWPAAPADARARADAVLEGRYDLLGYRELPFVDGQGQIDWHLDPVHARRAPLLFWADVPYLDPAIGDHKIIWELNRHQHWLKLGRAWWLTGDHRYRARIADELQSWLAANPPLIGLNWASMLELAFRALSWLWAMHFLLVPNPESPIPDPESTAHARRPWLVDMLIALDRQLAHVEQNLSIYFSPNTHLTGEALALYVVGVGVPELAASARWKQTGRRILLEELARQVHGDGGHAERSTHYQRYTLDFYLLALVTARRDGDADAERRFAEAVERLAVFTRAMADDSGRLPLIGDDDGGRLWPFGGRECADVRDSLAVAGRLLDRPGLAPWGDQEEAAWILGGTSGSSRTPARLSTSPLLPVASQLFPETGYAVLRDANGTHAVVDVGRHGYMNGGHAHADALSLTLSAAGRPLLVDPGTATYTMDRTLRDRFRSSESHNTLTVDGRSPSIPSGPFHWQSHADATLHGWRAHPALDWIEASHQGYAPLVHARSVVRTGDGPLLVVDEILGDGTHTASAHWHFDPQWALRSDAPGRLCATGQDGTKAWLLHDGGTIRLALGDEEAGIGWFAPVYGRVIPTWTARVAIAAAAPFTIITWIGIASDPPSMARVTPACPAGGRAAAVRITSRRGGTTMLVRPGEPPALQARDCRVAGYVTDARVLHVADEGGRVRVVDLVDATHLRADRTGAIGVAASDTMPDFHARVADGMLDLQASRPPAELRVGGAPVHAALVVRLNGRELPLPARARADSLLLWGADWP